MSDDAFWESIAIHAGFRRQTDGVWIRLGDPECPAARTAEEACKAMGAEFYGHAKALTERR